MCRPLTTSAYVALEASGRKRTGFVEAADKDQAIQKLTSKGRFFVEIRPDASNAKRTTPRRT